MKPVFIPDHYITQYRTAKVGAPPYSINVLKYDEFNNWKAFDTTAAVRKAITSKKIKIPDIFAVGVTGEDMWISTDFHNRYHLDVETHPVRQSSRQSGRRGRRAGRRGRGGRQVPSPTAAVGGPAKCYTGEQPISAAKKKDLLFLCKGPDHVIPVEYHEFYESLTTARIGQRDEEEEELDDQEEAEGVGEESGEEDSSSDEEDDE